MQAKDTVAKLETIIAGCKKKLTVADKANCDKLVKLYTGLPSYDLFKWLLAEVSSKEDKAWQINNTTKLGVQRSQSIEDQLLMTLMKLRLILGEEDLAFCFGIGQSG